MARGDKKERMLRILLNNPEGMTKYRIAKQAESSYAWTHEFLKLLENERLVKGTKVLNFPRLMNFWRSIHQKPKSREYMIQKPLTVLKKAKLDYALTTYQGENLVQKYLFPSRVDFYIREKDLRSWHEILSGQGLVGKGNVRILLADEHVFYKSFRKEGFNIVSPPQLILDLLEEGSVCEEAARMLIEKVGKDAL